MYMYMYCCFLHFPGLGGAEKTTQTGRTLLTLSEGTKHVKSIDKNVKNVWKEIGWKKEADEILLAEVV